MGFTLDRSDYILGMYFTPETYIGLSSTEPTEKGRNFSEPSPNSGYKRVKIGILNKKIKGQIANEATMFFDESVKGGYGEVAYFGCFDSEESEVPFFTGKLKESKYIGEGYVPIFRKRQFVIALDKEIEDYGEE